ncbi:MAG: hypothetical protein ABI588_11490 [Arenimonas sp.]
MTRNDRWLALILAVIGGFSLWWLAGSAPIGSRTISVADPSVAKLGKVWVGQTNNYEITSHATVVQTQQAGSTVEALTRAYLQLFGLEDKVLPRGGLKLTLYKDAAGFAAHASAPAGVLAWYRAPICYAYFDAGEPAASRWMLHAATHQLNHEALHPKSRWIDEGLASYFAASRVEDYTLVAGKIEPHAYPASLLPRLELSGDLKQDFAADKLVPLRALITGKGGPDINTHVNAFYIGYWSLTHFLLHAEAGRYAAKYRELASAGGSLEDFERLIGPVDTIQSQWYRYLQGLSGVDPDQVIVVD